MRLSQRIMSSAGNPTHHVALLPRAPAYTTPARASLSTSNLTGSLLGPEIVWQWETKHQYCPKEKQKSAFRQLRFHWRCCFVVVPKSDNSCFAAIITHPASHADWHGIWKRLQAVRTAHPRWARVSRVLGELLLMVGVVGHGTDWHLSNRRGGRASSLTSSRTAYSGACRSRTRWKQLYSLYKARCVLATRWPHRPLLRP